MPLVFVVIYLMSHELKDKVEPISQVKTPFRLSMQTMDDGIINGFESLIKICGYIILFSIITEISSVIIANITTNPPLILSVLMGNLEITNGINLLADIEINQPIKYIIAIQMLSFGGLSGFAQSASILSNAGLSMHKYIIGKALLSLLLTLLSVIYVLFIRLL